MRFHNVLAFQKAKPYDLELEKINQMLHLTLSSKLHTFVQKSSELYVRLTEYAKLKYLLGPKVTWGRDT